MPGGTLAVPNSNRVVPIANKVIPHFDLIVACQDWHPKNHGSFAKQHRRKKPGDQVKLCGLEQLLWPEHCVQGSKGAEFVKELDRSQIERIFQKGTDSDVDSYSAFFDNAHRKSTGLHRFLKDHNVDTIYILGLTTDYCVKYSVFDALALGLNVFVIIDGCAGIDLSPGDIDKAIDEMKSKGANIITSSALAKPIAKAA